MFTILAFIGQAHHINHFLQETRLQDTALPFRAEDADLFPVIENNRTFFEEFYENQWEFCVNQLNDRLEKFNLDHDRILPFTLLERLDKTQGSGASVHKIKVDGEYDGLGGSQVPYSVFLSLYIAVQALTRTGPTHIHDQVVLPFNA